MSASGHEQTLRNVRVMSVIPLKSDIRQRIEHVCFVPLADVELAKAPIESESNLRLSKKSLSGLGETKFHLRTLLDARLKPTSDCKSTTTQILCTIGEGQIKYQTPSVTLFRQEHPNRCLCLGVR
jgi:hypothetical protein